MGNDKKHKNNSSCNRKMNGKYKKLLFSPKTLNCKMKTMQKAIFLFSIVTLTLFTACNKDETVTNTDADKSGLYIGNLSVSTTGTTSNFSLLVVKSSGDNYNMTLQGLVPLKGTIIGNKLDVPKQIVSGSGTTRAEWEGSGTFSGNEVSVVFKNYVGGVAGSTYTGKLKK